jgi:hypothetical protein
MGTAGYVAGAGSSDYVRGAQASLVERKPMTRANFAVAKFRQASIIWLLNPTLHGS